MSEKIDLLLQEVQKQTRLLESLAKHFLQENQENQERQAVAFLDTNLIAKMLSKSEQTIRLWIKKGKIKAVKSKESRQGRYLVPKEEIKKIKNLASLGK